MKGFNGYNIPDFSEEVPESKCVICGESINTGQYYVDCYSGKICEDCLKDMTFDELMTELCVHMEVAS